MRFLLLLFGLIFFQAAFGQLYINEFMAANSSTISDPDFNDDADWIEIYNAGNISVNLNGYFLTDDLLVKNRYKIGDITIPANGYLIFWADGNSSGVHTNFKLDALGEQIGLFNPLLQCIDSITFSLQQTNISQGRNLNNLSQWGFYNQATPGTINNTLFYNSFTLHIPGFSRRGGIYQAPVKVELTTAMGGTIRYTTDGSEPTENSTIYTNPILMNTTTIIRSRIFRQNSLPGPVITNTYFIDASIPDRKLPVVSIASNPANFWDAQIGIYVQDFKPDWEIPVNIEMFENNGTDRASFNEKAGVKINGLYSWQLPQKMLGIYFDKQYGSSTLDFPLFYNNPRVTYETFALRASGSDWSYTLIRDIIGQHAPRLNMSLDIMDYRWCMVFFNGQYMGIHNFREKIETDYIEQHYGLDAGTFDMIENEDYAECGNLDAYNELKTLFSKDLSVPTNFDAVAQKMDVENFANLVITEMATGNSSIDHNVMAWKPKDSGKWRWILMDLDRGFFSVESRLMDFYLKQTSFPFNQLMQNENYRHLFGVKLADHLFTTFHPDRMADIIQEHVLAIEPDIENHVARWLGTTSSYGNAMPSVDYWYNELSKVVNYVYKRPSVLLNDLTNYGFSASSSLETSVYPEKAGSITFNNLLVPKPEWKGFYPVNETITLAADEKAGFRFIGWQESQLQTVIPAHDTWKYLDSGIEPSTGWKDISFNDDAWKTGNSEFGYGDGDENTLVGYGGNSNQKFITSWFRKDFELTATDLEGVHFAIDLLVDDGAVVYLNGKEVARRNMTYGPFSSSTLATEAIGGTDEELFTHYILDKNLLHSGVNVIAVEVHQNSASSSDLSFDLALTFQKPSGNTYLTTEKTLSQTFSGNKRYLAIFESTGECSVPSEITSSLTLYQACSPYVVPENVTLSENAELLIEPGVELQIAKDVQFFIHGVVKANGTEQNPIKFTIHPKDEENRWGALNFENTTGTSELSYVSFSHASKGPVPERVGAVSCFYGNIKLSHITFDTTNLNPMTTRYSDVEITDSRFQSSVTSDLINIKYGHGIIDRCTFVGNAQFDSDAIDYDGIENGIIKNTLIYNILGDNADAIDIGEQATNILIDSVIVYQAFDKGISVGQQSSVVLKNSIFLNCNLGAGIKDSSHIDINHSVFYGCGIPVDCYEKNPGLAGGNAIIRNSVLSNSNVNTYQSDEASKIIIQNTLSDDAALPDHESNLWGNAEFLNPNLFNFGYQSNSPCLNAASDTMYQSTLGIPWNISGLEPLPFLCQIYTNPINDRQFEYLALYNPSESTMDVSGFSIDKGVTCLFPSGSMIPAHDTLFITNNKSALGSKKWVVQWSSGKLSDNGEAIQLKNAQGLVIDYLNYNKEDGWPVDAFDYDEAMVLKASNLDNHLPESWEALPVVSVVSVPGNKQEALFSIYPNPAISQINLQYTPGADSIAEIYTSLGQSVFKIQLDSEGSILINLTHFLPGLYIVRVNDIYTRFLKF